MEVVARYSGAPEIIEVVVASRRDHMRKRIGVGEQIIPIEGCDRSGVDLTARIGVDSVPAVRTQTVVGKEIQITRIVRES